MITYGLAKSVLAKYVGLGGTCPNEDSVNIFVRQALQYLLLQGTYGNIRKFVFHAVRGCFTLPRELDVPLKIKFDCAVGTVWSRWFEYQSGNTIDGPCVESASILEEPNQYPTAYDIPTCGMFPAVEAHCEEDCDAHVIVKGKDLSGREIFTFHKGEEVTGVYLTIEKGKINRSHVAFGKITEVYKTKTNGYVTLLAVDDCNQQRVFLSDYEPYEQTPSYRRIRLLIPDCPPVCKVSVLGRIKLKEHYSDTDLIPFDNLYLLEVAGQSINKMYNTDVQTALAQDAYVKNLIETEGNYKKVNNGSPLEMFVPLSGGAVRNANAAWPTYSGWRWGYGWNGRR